MKRAIEFLAVQPEWDGKILIVKGTSQGGSQAIVAAGLDNRVTMIGANIPAMCNQPGPVSGWPWLVDRPYGKPNPQMLKAARYFDPVNFASRSKAKAIISVGFIDVVCPPTTVYLAYNNFRNKKQIINRPLMSHAAEPDIKGIFAYAFKEYIQERKN